VSTTSVLEAVVILNGVGNVFRWCGNGAEEGMKISPTREEEDLLFKQGY
jgi:hypothetical protein